MANGTFGNGCYYLNYFVVDGDHVVGDGGGGAVAVDDGDAEDG